VVSCANPSVLAHRSLGFGRFARSPPAYKYRNSAGLNHRRAQLAARCTRTMRTYIRGDAAGATYFFTLTLQDRGARWLVDHVDVLRAAVKHVKARHPFDIEAMVVLPEHLHALWRLPVDDKDFSTRWMLVKQTFTQSLVASGVLRDGVAPGRGLKGERKVWQRRFWEHQIRDEEDFQRHVEYIHYNPVKHGWVTRAAEWPHSSLHRFIREGTVAADWGISAAVEGQFGE
jgi:putative transposase